MPTSPVTEKEPQQQHLVEVESSKRALPPKRNGSHSSLLTPLGNGSSNSGSGSGSGGIGSSASLPLPPKRGNSLGSTEKSRLDALMEQDTIANQQTMLKRAELVELGEDKALFEFVVVVSLREDPNKKGMMEPFISYSFPPSIVQKKKNEGLMQSIPLFCFPDIDLIEATDNALKKETYSFVLTDIDGSRRHGYCRRMLTKGTGKRWPVTYCIISSQYVSTLSFHIIILILLLI